MTREEFLKRLLGYFGLTEAIRSDSSFEALKGEIHNALLSWLGKPANDLTLAWTFPDRIIAYQWNEGNTRVWEVPWSRDEAGAIVFGTPSEVKQVMTFEPMAEAQAKPAKGSKFTETIDAAISLGEAQADNGGRRIKAIGITADVTNANGRRYPRRVLAAAVAKLNSHLSESNGQGRYIATGEAEHPSDKGTRPSVTETVVRWDAASLNSSGKVLLEGAIIPTSKGKDIQAILEAGIKVGVSMRGFGSFVAVTEGGESVNEVTDLTIRGFDLVAQPSDPNGAITEAEDEAKPAQEAPKEKRKMELEELIKLIKANPAMLAGIMESLNLADAKALTEALANAEKATSELAERKNADAVEAAVAEGTKDLPYGEALNALFADSVRAAKPANVETAKALIESMRVNFDKVAADKELGAKGKVKVVGPVFESQTGQPEFSKAAFEITESLVAAQEGTRHNLTAPVTPGEFFAKKVLAEFDRRNRNALIVEAKAFNEAEQTSDLNLPYSIARAIIEQAYPELIAASVYDFGTAANSPERIYFESYTGESGSYATVADEVVTADTGVWVAMANKRLRPGTVVVTHTSGAPTYVDGTDYVIDYEVGKLWAISGGAIADNESLKVDYTYDLFRKGEMVAIQRAKNALTFMQMDMAADRLATQISSEAIVFSRSQMGYDAVTRTLGNLSRLVKRKIDKDILFKGLAASLIQASNSGGTWTSASDDVALLVKYLGIAKSKVANRFYEPTSIVMSVTIADYLSNWDGFRRDGFGNATMNAAGYAGSVKGLPIFASPEYPDSYAQVVHRELVAHRVYNPMIFKGPFPSYDSNGNLIGADQYYCEEFNGSMVPVVEKTAHVKIA
jgi:hypothetical protein